jgi:hypothetical protein
VTLNDEQVDMLHRHGEVLEARRKFLARLAEGFKAGGQETIDEAHNVLKPEYERLFQARLAWVEQYPPEPKAKPVVVTGFAKRA